MGGQREEVQCAVLLRHVLAPTSSDTSKLQTPGPLDCLKKCSRLTDKHTCKDKSTKTHTDLLVGVEASACMPAEARVHVRTQIHSDTCVHVFAQEVCVYTHRCICMFVCAHICRFMQYAHTNIHIRLWPRWGPELRAGCDPSSHHTCDSTVWGPVAWLTSSFSPLNKEVK